MARTRREVQGRAAQVVTDVHRSLGVEQEPARVRVSVVGRNVEWSVHLFIRPIGVAPDVLSRGKNSV